MASTDAQEKLVARVNHLTKVVKSLMETQKKSDEKIDKLEKHVEYLEGKMVQTDKENYDYVKELQDNKYKVVEEIKTVEGKLLKIDEEIAVLKLKQAEKVDHSNGQSIKDQTKKTDMHDCKKCDAKFHARENLQYHIKTRHKIEVQCRICDLPFGKKCSLELHMESVHGKKKQYKCDKCSMGFFLQWRLKKHMSVHSDDKTRKCHFFNNDKPCPYQKLGCKFLHVKAGMCEFKDNCAREKCQFQHTSQ